MFINVRLFCLGNHRDNR